MITMSVALSEQCNLNCTYCNVDKLSKKRISSKLFLDEFWKKRAELPNEKFQIDLYGGEPLLQWDLVKEIIDATQEEKNLQYFMPTNGLLLNDERVDYLNEHNVKVSLSFDGLWQDENRKQHDSKGSTNQYLSKKPLFDKLKNKECHSMIYKGNVNLLENHLFILETLNLNPNLTLIRDIGVWEDEDTQKFNEAFTELINWYIENVETAEMPRLMREYLGHIVLYASKKRSTDYCGASETHFSFTENKLIACNRFKSQDMINKIPSFRKMQACETCEVNKFCKKGCLFENIKNEGPIKEICGMYKHIYRELQRMSKALSTNSTFKNLMMEIINEC
jgi:uncharacterized protein